MRGSYQAARERSRLVRITAVRYDRPREASRSDEPASPGSMWTSKPSAGVLLALAVAGTAFAKSPQRYNMLLVSIDSLRRDAVGCYGSTLLRGPHPSPTPNLDRLAATGVRMADAYANS